MKITSIVKKYVKLAMYGYRGDQEVYKARLRKLGAKIGEDVNFFSSQKVNFDVLNCHMIEIGNHVNIVGSTILTHDYAWSVIKNKYGEILGNQRPVKIGNNVFIGAESIVMGGSDIGNNVIIGAHSVVSGHILSDSVYAGNPAVRIMSLEDYRQKRDKRQFQEAQDFVLKYRDAHGVLPPIEKMHEYFFLFEKSTDGLNKVFDAKLKLTGNYKQSCSSLKMHKAMFNDYKEFLDACINKKIHGGAKEK